MLFERFLRNKSLMAAMALTAVMPSVAKASILSAAPTAEGGEPATQGGEFISLLMTSVRQARTSMSMLMRVVCMERIILLLLQTILMLFSFMLRATSIPFRV